MIAPVRAHAVGRLTCNVHYITWRKTNAGKEMSSHNDRDK